MLTWIKADDRGQRRSGRWRSVGSSPCGCWPNIPLQNTGGSILESPRELRVRLTCRRCIAAACRPRKRAAPRCPN